MLNRKFAVLLFLLIVINQSIHGKEKNCENYPYKEGLYFQKSLGNIDKAVNEVIMETIDIFILKDKDNPTVSFKKLYMIWSDMIKGK